MLKKWIWLLCALPLLLSGCHSARQIETASVIENVSVHMEKNTAVTAGVLGAGPFADCGSFTVTMNVNEATDFSFSYPGEEE